MILIKKEKNPFTDKRDKTAFLSSLKIKRVAFKVHFSLVI